MIGGSGLTPSLAVDYVRELSADVRAVVVLGAGGELLAGPRELAGAAHALLAAGGAAAELEAGCDAGVVCAVRAPTHTAIAVCGRFAIGGLVREDLRAALGALEGRALDRPPRDAGAAPDAALVSAAEAPDAALLSAAEALISAVQRASSA